MTIRQSSLLSIVVGILACVFLTHEPVRGSLLFALGIGSGVLISRSRFVSTTCSDCPYVNTPRQDGVVRVHRVPTDLL